MGTSSDTQSPATTDRKGAREMSAQTPYLEVDAIGVFPYLVVLMLLVLAALGIVAHAAAL